MTTTGGDGTLKPVEALSEFVVDAEMEEAVEAGNEEVAEESEEEAIENAHGLYDRDWKAKEWQELIERLVADGFFTWGEVASLVLGHLNPSQIGTSLASSEGFKRNYGKGNTMAIAMSWFYEQDGRCATCGTRLELQADHAVGKETFEDPLDADQIENMTLRCRRCNVVKRASHTYGGRTNLTAEAALMWILLQVRPRNFLDFVRLCRVYGMTMSDIRMGEAWAMAHWLSRTNPPLYRITSEGEMFDLHKWPDGAVTRTVSGTTAPDGAETIASGVGGAMRLSTLYQRDELYIHTQEVAMIPFSYELWPLPPQSLAIRYIPPKRKEKRPPSIEFLPPRGGTLKSHVLHSSELVAFALVRREGRKDKIVEAAKRKPRIVPGEGEGVKIELQTKNKDGKLIV
jgi:hypothetical protein